MWNCFANWSKRLGPGLALFLIIGCAAAPPAAHNVPPAERHRTATASAPDPIQATPTIDLASMSNLEGIIPQLADKRVVFIGETHTRYDHHLTQLEIIRRLHAIHPKLAIGLEFFQQPFQEYLDSYVAGKLSDRELLRGTEYYQRWRHDFRLYAPILRYAKDHQLPLVALNLPSELTRKAGREGLDSLTEVERVKIPDEIDYSDTDYRRRLEEIYAMHPHKGQSFTNFLTVQLLWDEGMAQQAADWLKAYPEYHMVILAGSGHLAYGSGIPQRLRRRLPVSSAIILNDWGGTLEAGLADFLLLPQERSLPPPGRFGALLDDDNTSLKVSSCMPDSPCETVGIKRGDQLISINGTPITSMADLRLATWDKNPGDTVTLEIRRQRLLSPAQELTYELILQ